MAKSHGGGPGTYSTNGVRCTMDAPFDKAAKSRTGTQAGIDGRNKPPFSQPQGMANGSIPTRFFDESMSDRAAKSTSSAGASTPIGITKRNPSERRFTK